MAPRKSFRPVVEHLERRELPFTLVEMLPVIYVLPALQGVAATAADARESAAAVVSAPSRSLGTSSPGIVLPGITLARP